MRRAVFLDPKTEEPFFKVMTEVQVGLKKQELLYNHPREYTKKRESELEVVCREIEKGREKFDAYQVDWCFFNKRFNSGHDATRFNFRNDVLAYMARMQKLRLQVPYSDALLCDIERRGIIHNQSFDPMFSIDVMIDFYGIRSNLELAIVSRSNLSRKLREWVDVMCQDEFGETWASPIFERCGLAR